MFFQLRPAVHDAVATDMTHLEVDRVGNVPSMTCSSLDSQPNSPSGPKVQCLPGSEGHTRPIASLKCQHVIPECYLGRDVPCTTGSCSMATVNSFQNAYDGRGDTINILNIYYVCFQYNVFLKMLLIPWAFCSMYVD